MRRQLINVIAAGALLAAWPVSAATVSVSVSADGGKPAENAVVELVPEQGSAGPAFTSVPAEAIIDQRNETFLPLVSVIRKGGRVTFTNNDTTMHQVYSFSDVKQFAFEIDEGQRSTPVVFDKAGVAAVGCNIHDQMITYVYVSAAPWAARTDATGHVQIVNIPPGRYRATVWHPQLASSQSLPPAPLIVAGDSAKLTLAVALSSTDPRGKKHMHKQMY